MRSEYIFEEVDFSKAQRAYYRDHYDMPTCGAVSSSGKYLCTRVKNHQGYHEACLFDNKMHTTIYDHNKTRTYKCITRWSDEQ
jgi:hypothetical protein